MASYSGRVDGSMKNIVDPEGGFHFALEIEGIEVANFLEVSGVKTHTTVFEIEEGGLNQFVHKLPGQSRWENVVLRFGITSDGTLLQWRDEVLQDEFSARRNGAIIVKNLEGEEVRRYSFKNGWPVAWEGPAFNANNAELAVEMIEIAHHGIEVSIS